MSVTGLAGMAEVHPYQLSLAVRRRVTHAAVLAMDTPIVVRDVGTAVAELAGRGRTVLAITHDIDLCAEHFDRIVVMAEGRVARDGAPGEVFGATEDLRRAAVRAPQMMRLTQALAWQRPVSTVDAFVDRLGGAGG